MTTIGNLVLIQVSDYDKKVKRYPVAMTKLLSKFFGGATIVAFDQK